MTSIGIICPPERGHLNPAVRLAAELNRSSRYTVHGISFEPGRDLFHAEHIDFVNYAEYVSFFRSQELGERNMDQGSQFGNDLTFEITNQSLRDRSTGRYDVANAISRIVDDHRLDALIIDSFIAPEIVNGVEKAGTPWVLLHSAVCTNHLADFFESCLDRRILDFESEDDFIELQRTPNLDPLNILQVQSQVIELWNQERETFGLARIDVRRLEDQYSQHPPVLKIAQQHREFEYPGLFKDTHYAGVFVPPGSSTEPGFDFAVPAGDNPLVYVSMGTFVNRHPEFFVKVDRAFREIDARVILSLGGGLTEKDIDHEFGPNVSVHEWVPQLDVLARADLFITHAGMNSTLEGLRAGTPLLAIPVTGDQFAIANRIAGLDLGKVVPFRNVTVDRLREGVASVVEDHSYRARCQLQRDHVARSGCYLAAELIASVT